MLFFKELLKNYKAFTNQRNKTFNNISTFKTKILLIKILGISSTFLIGKLLIYKYHENEIKLIKKNYINSFNQLSNNYLSKNQIEDSIHTNELRELLKENIKIINSRYNYEKIKLKDILIINKISKDFIIENKPFLLIFSEEEFKYIKENPNYGYFILEFKLSEQIIIKKRFKERSNKINKFINNFIENESLKSYSNVPLKIIIPIFEKMRRGNSLFFDIDSFIVKEIFNYTNFQDFQKENTSEIFTMILEIINLTKLNIIKTYGINKTNDYLKEIIIQKRLIELLLSYYIFDNIKKGGIIYFDFFTSQFNERQ